MPWTIDFRILNGKHTEGQDVGRTIFVDLLMIIQQGTIHRVGGGGPRGLQPTGQLQVFAIIGQRRHHIRLVVGGGLNEIGTQIRQTAVARMIGVAAARRQAQDKPQPMKEGLRSHGLLVCSIHFHRKSYICGSYLVCMICDQSKRIGPTFNLFRHRVALRWFTTGLAYIFSIHWRR